MREVWLEEAKVILQELQALRAVFDSNFNMTIKGMMAKFAHRISGADMAMGQAMEFLSRLKYYYSKYSEPKSVPDSLAENSTRIDENKTDTPSVPVEEGPDVEGVPV